jgi:hypothetical protein
VGSGAPIGSGASVELNRSGSAARVAPCGCAFSSDGIGGPAGPRRLYGLGAAVGGPDLLCGGWPVFLAGHGLSVRLSVRVRTWSTYRGQTGRQALAQARWHRGIQGSPAAEEPLAPGDDKYEVVLTRQAGWGRHLLRALQTVCF